MYEEPIPKIIHQLKYNGLFSLALPLANLMCQAWPKWTHQFDMIIPIPLHPERERKRGYNQAELLAKVVGQSIDISCNNRALQRIKNTQPQVRLNLLQRRENVKFAFKADKDLVRNKNLLLVDDVCTTGATLSSAAETLIASGANIVSAYCLARA